MTAPTPSPGWYSDPAGGGGQRYWNGVQWTEQRVVAQKGPGKRLAWGFVAVLVLFFGGCTVLAYMETNAAKENSGSGHTPGTGSGTFGENGDSDLQTASGLQQPVRDGEFEFVVTGVYPQGEYTVVRMTVTNIGNQAQTFFPQNQKLIDSAGRQYDADTMAVYDYNKDGIVELNPGLGTTSIVPFKAPPGTTFSAVELHDSAFSSGATVKLG